MCGINGFSFNDEKLILGMVNKTHHRGPDDEGILLGKKISFGHNRLSIIDLSSAGHQPMTTKDGKFSIIFNGEIYNFLEIKNQLKVLVSSLCIIISTKIKLFFLLKLKLFYCMVLKKN